MADLEQRVDRLEEKVSKLELDIKASLGDIQTDLTEIKTYMKKDDENSDLKNKVIEKDVKHNEERITKLENNQSKVVWAIVSAFLTLLIEAVALYLRTK